ncbi:elongation factor Ts [Candidatus Dojkabacteria bacterium]|uniref:Elongation factor Ts n=1 Tax=Candidatus Dojkabacteria bacterium TaxID=2099670 RepID=A0A3M0Z3Z9_9BACT|nr:MAG: elongation factor Ts [Candidatus Dojkabacteria bacterium]
MAEVGIDLIKKLRDISGAGLGACKEALSITGGNMDEAMKYLREKGLAKSIKRQSNVAENGYISVYRHSDRLIVVLQLACETDFAARSEVFKKFADDLALHVAAAAPQYKDVDSIPDEVLKQLKNEFYEGLEEKPKEVAEKIVEGKLSKFYSENVLTEQRFFLDESKTVKDAINELVARLGEKVEISYFYKFDVKNGIYFSP